MLRLVAECDYSGCFQLQCPFMSAGGGPLLGIEDVSEGDEDLAPAQTHGTGFGSHVANGQTEKPAGATASMIPLRSDHETEFQAKKQRILSATSTDCEDQSNLFETVHPCPTMVHPATQLLTCTEQLLLGSENSWEYDVFKLNNATEVSLLPISSGKR
jgi:hypothetical protein